MQKNKKYVELKYRQIIRSIHEGRYGYCTNYSQGRTLHLWEIKITDEEEFDFALQVD
jgi:hypothetical protein